MLTARVHVLGQGVINSVFYKNFIQNFEVETYCTSVYKRSHRRALARFRSFTAPIAIEIGRYSGFCIDERKCFSCKDIVDDEIQDTRYKFYL